MDLWKHPYIQCISDMFCTLASCQIRLNHTDLWHLLKTTLCQCDIKLKLKNTFCKICIFCIEFCSSSHKPSCYTYTLLLLKTQRNIRLHAYTSQFHSWKQRFMIIKFRCAVWLDAFERPTACDLILQTFGRVKGNMVSYKMLINVDGT